jgi:hypothetical protein
MSNIEDGLVGFCLGEKSYICLCWPLYVGQPENVIRELILKRNSLRTVVRSSFLLVHLCTIG